MNRRGFFKTLACGITGLFVVKSRDLSRFHDAIEGISENNAMLTEMTKGGIYSFDIPSNEMDYVSEPIVYYPRHAAIEYP